MKKEEGHEHIWTYFIYKYIYLCFIYIYIYSYIKHFFRAFRHSLPSHFMQLLLHPQRTSFLI